MNEKKQFVVYATSANYCGYGEYCRVWALDEEDAKHASSDYFEDLYYQQDEEQYIEENGEDYDCCGWSHIEEAYALDSEEAKDVRGYLQDPNQAHFYPLVN